LITVHEPELNIKYYTSTVTNMCGLQDIDCLWGELRNVYKMWLLSLPSYSSPFLLSIIVQKMLYNQGEEG